MSRPLQDATVRVILEFSRFESELRDGVERAAERAGRRFETIMRQRIAAAGRSSGRELGEALERSTQDAGDRSGRQFAVGLLGQIQRAGVSARGILRDSLSRFDGDARDAGKRVGDRFTSGFLVALKGIAIGSLLAGAVGGIAGGVSVITQLSAALAPLVGIVQVFPAAFAAAALAATTLSVATSGMGDALKAAFAQDPKALEKALKELSPRAREFVGEFTKIVPALREVRSATQDAFFRPLLGTFQRLRDELGTVITKGLTDTAAAAGRLGRSLVNVFASTQGATTLRNVFGATAGLLDRLAPAATTFGRGLLSVINATVPGLERINKAIVNVVTRVGEWLQRQADSGRALDSVNAALDAFTALGRILGNIGGILRSVFVGARASTGDFLASINDALEKTKDFLNSARGQTSLANFFKGLSDITRATAPIFRELLGLLGDVTVVAGRLAVALSGGVAVVLRSIGQAVRNAAPGLEDFAQSLSQVATEAAPVLAKVGTALGALFSAAVPLLPILSGVAAAVGFLADAFSALPGPIQTVLITLIALQRLGTFSFIGNMTVAARESTSVISRMADAYRTTSTSMLEFARQQQFLNTSIGPFPALLSGVQGPLNSFTAAASGVGAALSTGLRSAVTGLLGVLGGPWGVALAAASVGLSLLASRQADAARATADHQSRVSSLADTLNQQTGAITGATQKLLADEAAREGWLTTANKMGISSKTFVDALTGQQVALAEVELATSRVLRTQIQTSDVWKLNGDAAQKYGITLDLLALSAAGNKGAADQLALANSKAGGSFNELISTARFLTPEQTKLAGALNSTGKALDQAASQTQAAASAMDPATLQSQKLADALGVLSNNAAGADAQARALNDALNILNGGSLSADAAQAKFQETLANVVTQMQAAKARTDEFGVATVNAAGQLDVTNLAGRSLVDTAKSLQESLGQSATKTLELGRANGDVEGALRQVATNAQAARDAFIANAQAAGLNGEQAAALADKYGLIPKQVLTTVAAPGATETEQQLIQVQLALANTPPEKTVTVKNATEETIRKLKETGAQVNQIPGTKDITVRADTQTARNNISNLISSFAGRTIDLVTRIIGGGAIGGIQPVLPMMAGGIVGGTLSSSTAIIVPPKTFRMIGDRQIGDESFIPLIPTSMRSQQIWEESGRRLGREFAPLGGSAAAGGLFIAPGAVNVVTPYANPVLVAQQVLNEAARRVMIGV